MRTTLTVLLALIWLPLTSHCLLFESAANFEFLSCCTHEDTPSHHDDCATDACATIESAKYKSSLQRIIIAPPDHRVAFELPPPLDIKPASAQTATQRHDTIIRLLVTWQFSARTALPPRAPSFVS